MNYKNNIKFWLIILVILAIGIIVFSTKDQTTDNSVTIGYSALRISLPVFVAQEKGYFKEEGLNIKLERFDTAQPLIDALVTGSIEAGGYTALPIAYSAMLRSKTPLLFTTALLEDKDHRLSYLIVPNKTPGDFTIKNLTKKKVGIRPTAAYKAWFTEILKHYAIDPYNVEVTPIDPSLELTALQSGQVDALFTNDPVATTVIQKGVGRLLSGDIETIETFGSPFLFGSFNIRKDFAIAHPETANKIAHALDRAIIFITDHQAESKQLLTQYLAPTQAPFVSFYPDSLYQTSLSTDRVQFQHTTDTYYDLGLIPEHINTQELILRADRSNDTDK